MVRTRFVALALPILCFLSAGCTSTSSNNCGDNRGFFARLFSPREKECCEMMPSCSCCNEGPMLSDPSMMGAGTLPYPTPLPLTQPPANPPARISPVPQAYQPTSRKYLD
jgi:hypothetical protein